jgi:hypothetical protein
MFAMMDWWWIIKLFWGGIGLGLACLLLIAVWRAQGIIVWNRSLQKELKALDKEAETVSLNRSKRHPGDPGSVRWYSLLPVAPSR